MKSPTPPPWSYSLSRLYCLPVFFAWSRYQQDPGRSTGPHDGGYGGMSVSDVRRLKQLEEENRRRKELVAELSLDNKMLKDVVSKNM